MITEVATLSIDLVKWVGGGIYNKFWHVLGYKSPEEKTEENLEEIKKLEKDTNEALKIQTETLKKLERAVEQIAEHIETSTFEH